MSVYRSSNHFKAKWKSRKLENARLYELEKIQTMSKLNPNLLVHFNSNKDLCSMLYSIRVEA